MLANGTFRSPTQSRPTTSRRKNESSPSEELNSRCMRAHAARKWPQRHKFGRGVAAEKAVVATNHYAQKAPEGQVATEDHLSQRSWLGRSLGNRNIRSYLMHRSIASVDHSPCIISPWSKSQTPVHRARCVRDSTADHRGTSRIVKCILASRSSYRLEAVKLWTDILPK